VIRALDTCTKWWGPDRHLATYPVTRTRDETYFVTSVPDPDWDVESWSPRGDMEEVCQAFTGFHPDAQRVLAASREVHPWYRALLRANEYAVQPGACSQRRRWLEWESSLRSRRVFTRSSSVSADRGNTVLSPILSGEVRKAARRTFRPHLS
jgi:hypothetical protein